MEIEYIDLNQHYYIFRLSLCFLILWTDAYLMMADIDSRNMS